MAMTITADSLLPRPKSDYDRGYDVAVKGAIVVVWSLSCKTTIRSWLHLQKTSYIIPQHPKSTYTAEQHNTPQPLFYLVQHLNEQWLHTTWWLQPPKFSAKDGPQKEAKGHWKRMWYVISNWSQVLQLTGPDHFSQLNPTLNVIIERRPKKKLDIKGHPTTLDLI